MQIRKGTLADYDLLAPMMESLHKVHADNRPDLFVQNDRPKSFAYYAQIVSQEDTSVFIAQQEDMACGYICAKLDCIPPSHPVLQSGCSYKIEDLFVKESFRGSDCAAQLYEAAKQDARARGAKYITLKVFSFNRRAKHFYEKMGLHVRSYELEQEIK